MHLTTPPPPMHWWTMHQMTAYGTRPAQARENVVIHWGVGLNKRIVARFYFPKDAADLRLMIGALSGRARMRVECVRRERAARGGVL